MKQSRNENKKTDTRKRILWALFAVLLGSSLAGCGRGNTTAVPASEEDTTAVPASEEDTAGGIREEIKIAPGSEYELHLEYGEDGELIRSSSYSITDGRLHYVEEYENGKMVKSYAYGIGRNTSMHNEVTYGPDGDWLTWLVFDENDELVSESTRDGLREEDIFYTDGQPKDWNIFFYDEGNRTLRQEYYYYQDDQWELQTVTLFDHGDSGEDMGEDSYLGKEEELLWVIAEWHQAYGQTRVRVDLYAVDRNADRSVFYTRETNDWEALGAVDYQAEAEDYEFEFDSEGFPTAFHYIGK